MNRNGLKIGEFSRLCRVTVRALRHYEKIKLLVPEIIDYSTGTGIIQWDRCRRL
jgi:hypothetical protein